MIFQLKVLKKGCVTSMANIAVIGNKDTVLAFKALGIDVYSSIKKDETETLIDRLAQAEYTVIFITEDIVSKVKETIAKYDNQFVPAIIPIPSHKGTKNIGMERIDENIEKAVGMNLF